MVPRWNTQRLTLIHLGQYKLNQIDTLPRLGVPWFFVGQSSHWQKTCCLVDLWGSTQLTEMHQMFPMKVIDVCPPIFSSAAPIYLHFALHPGKKYIGNTDSSWFCYFMLFHLPLQWFGILLELLHKGTNHYSSNHLPRMVNVCLSHSLPHLRCCSIGFMNHLGHLGQQ